MSFSAIRGEDTSITDTNLIFSAESDPYGLTYSEWAAEWWKWFLSIPKDDTHALDTTGEKCSQNQNNANVWFLAATYGGSVERKCTIPSDKSILLPVINVACSYAYFPSLKTEEELHRCASEEARAIYERRLVVDGVEFRDLDNYLFTSHAFNVTLPENNVWEQPPNTETAAVTVGYYVMLKPLSPGDHTIQYGGAAGNPSINSEENFATSVTLHIRVE